MKTGLLWSLIIASIPSYSFAAQAVDCDELARHVSTKMERLYPVVAIDKDGVAVMIDTISDIVHDGPWMERRLVEIKSRCKQKWVDKRSFLERPFGYGIDKLPTSLKQLEDYEAALMRCTKAAPKSCPYAKEIIFKIQTQKILNSRCTDLYAQSVKEHEERWANERLETSKRKTFDAYIDASKR